ncbi:neuropeptides B/W receptor type 1-like [Mytilus californianus]|uniref:neuropeptides B/W receptor type 1-like n=1 Tax=Mytilus californianus TaxID=6549 RepID=UPI00224676DF|nr:neuropeptides B/W receptor type 1-like [Mytilus californianus]
MKSSRTTVSDWNDYFAIILIPNSIFLVLYLSLGITGNSLVIAVYRLRMKQQSEDRYFIPVLAVCALSACIVCVSMAIALNMISEELNRSIMYKFTLMFMAITIIFLISFIPKIFFMVMEGRDSEFWEKLSSSERAGLRFLYRLYILNNVVNPFIYAFMDMKFRKEAKKLIKCIL